MPSKKLQTRETQKARYSRQLETRNSLLKDKGIPADKLAKDPQIKHFKARIKQIDKAVARITFLDKQTKELKEKKELKIAEAAKRRAEMIAGTFQKKVKEEKLPEPPKKGKAAAKPGQAKPGQAKAAKKDPKKKGS
jgi:hypothetical protein